MVGWRNEEIVHVPLSKTFKLEKSISDDMLNAVEIIGTFLPKN